MKLLLFLYFSAVYSHPQKKYTTELHSKALGFIWLQWGGGVLFVTFGFVHCFGVWSWIIAHWPYEFGHNSRWDWQVPTAIVGIPYIIFSERILRLYFGCSSVQQEIVSRFDNDFGRALSDKTEWWSVLLIPLNIFAGVVLWAGHYEIFVCCLPVWIAAELWIRHKFYGPQPEIVEKPRKRRKDENRRNS